MNSSTFRIGLAGKPGGGEKALEAVNPLQRIFGPDDLEKHLREQAEAAKADYEKFGFEARGEVDRLPALAEGEMMVIVPQHYA
jgi:hypothetical protein